MIWRLHTNLCTLLQVLVFQTLLFSLLNVLLAFASLFSISLLMASMERCFPSKVINCFQLCPIYGDLRRMVDFLWCGLIENSFLVLQNYYIVNLSCA